MENKFKLKKFLATASAFAMITGASSAAMGANAQTSGNAGAINSFSTNGHWDNPPVGSGDNLILGNANDVINIDVGNFHITQIDFNGNNSGGIAINANGTKLGNVIANGGNAGALTFGGAHDITLVGGNAAGRGNASVYDGIEDVNFAGHAATLTIDTAMNIAIAGPNDVIDLAGVVANAGNATLNVSTDLNVADESWGAIKTINIGTGAVAKTFKIESAGAHIALNNTADARINFLHNDSVLHLENTGGVHNAVINNGYLGGKTDGSGKIIIKSNGNAMDVAIANGATIGKSVDSRLGTLIFNGDKALTVNAVVFAKNIDFGIVTAGQNLVFAKDVTGGDNSKFKYIHANAQVVEFRGNTQITDIDFDNKAGTIKVSDAKTLTANIYGDQGAVNIKGTLELLGDSEFVGTASNLVLINAGDNNKKARIGAGDHTTDEVKTLHAAGTIDFADGANILTTATADSGSIDRTGGNAGKLVFEGSSVIAGTIGVNAPVVSINVTGGADKTVEFKAATNATNLNIGKAAQDGAAKVKIGKDLTVNVSFLDNVSKGGELVIYGAAPHGIAGNINKNIDADEARGKITIAGGGVVGTAVGANAVTFAGQIGDTANNKAVSHLHILNNDAGGSVVLGGDAHIRKIQAAGAGDLKLNKAAANYKFGQIILDTDNAFSLSVNENGVLKAPAEGVVNFGSIENGGKRLSELKFTANKTLIIENGVNIYANKLNETGVANDGKLIFAGDSIFSAKSDGQNIKVIEVNADKTVTLLQDIKTHEGIKLSNNATLVVAGNVTAGIAGGGGVNGLIGAADGNGKLKFINSPAVAVTGLVGGAVARLQSIEFNGGNVEFVNAVTHTRKDFIFSGTNPSKVTFTAAGYGDANFVNNSEAGVTHTIVVNTNENLIGNVAIDNADTKQINFDLGTNNKTITVNGAAQANGANFINGGADDKGALILDKADVTVNSVGTSAKKLAALNINKNATIKKGAHAVTTTIAAGESATIGGEILGTDLNLVNAGSAVNFLDGVKLNVATTGTVAGEGLVVFEGGGSIEANKVITNVRSVAFSDITGKVLTISANIAAEKIDIKKGTFKTGNNNVLLTAPDVNSANASFDLASGVDIVVNGDLTFSGAEGKIAVTVIESGNQLGTGQIIAGAGTTLTYDNGAKVTVTPDDSNGNRPAGGATRTFTLIVNNTGNAAVGTLLVDIDQNKNPFTKWTSKSENGSLIFIQTDGAKDKILETLGSSADATTKSNFEKLIEAQAGTDGAKIINIAAGIFNDKSLSTSQIQEKTQELNDRLTPITTTTDSIETTMSNASSTIGTRVMSVAKPTVGTSVLSRAAASEKVSGIAAGDDHARYGAWFSPFFSKTTQKAKKGAAGYRDTSYGGSFGMDTKANDDLIIGGALTFANSEMKHRDFKSGDKTKVNSLMLSIYGLQNITDTWFAQGSFSIASNEVKNLERKVATATSYESTNGKYNSMSFAGDVLFGYNYAVEGFNLTPMGGLKYTRVNSAGYNESGSTTGQNANISQKASNKLEVAVGARASGGTFDANGMSVTPEVHGFINHDIIGKNPKQDIRIGGVSGSLDATKSRKLIKTSYNLGLGANANYGMMEYGAGYDLHLADNRVGHEGSLKLRVNF